MDIQNSHDKYFKEIFTQIEPARSFVENYLPKDISCQIDSSTLEIMKDSFVSKELSEIYSDVLYRVDIKGEIAYIYILMDHKSYPDKAVSFQLLKYKYLIWEKEIKGNRKWKKLPLIIPLVFYHGKEKWKIESNFSDIVYINEKSLEKYAVNFDYILCDLSELSDDEILGNVLLKLVIFTFKHIFDNRSSVVDCHI